MLAEIASHASFRIASGGRTPRPPPGGLRRPWTPLRWAGLGGWVGGWVGGCSVPGFCCRSFVCCVGPGLLWLRLPLFVAGGLGFLVVGARFLCGMGWLRSGVSVRDCRERGRGLRCSGLRVPVCSCIRSRTAPRFGGGAVVVLSGAAWGLGVCCCWSRGFWDPPVMGLGGPCNLFEYHNGAGWSSSVARWAHNPEVAGSNPVPATTKRRVLGKSGNAPLFSCWGGFCC